MNATCCSLPAPIPLHRPLWVRLADTVMESLGRLRARLQLGPRVMELPAMGLQDAMALNDQTLRDIGAPEWLRDEAAARRGIDSMVLRAARLDHGGDGARWYG